jgi:hypothetical protein
VACVFINVAGRPRHGQLAFPRPRECGAVIDFKSIENRIRVEQAEAFHDVQVSIPAEHAAGFPVKAAAVVEVRGVDHERAAFPMSDRVAEPEP